MCACIFLFKILVSNVSDYVCKMFEFLQDLKVEISHWQMTVDFLRRLAPTSVNSIDDDGQTEYSEHLGLTSRRFDVVATETAERLKKTEVLSLNWTEFRQSISEILNWLNQQLKTLEDCQSISHLDDIQQAVLDIQVICKC